MLNRLKSWWRAWCLKRLKIKRERLEVAYLMSRVQLGQTEEGSQASEIRTIWIKELERRVLRVDKKIAALEPSEAAYQDYHLKDKNRHD